MNNTWPKQIRHGSPWAHTWSSATGYREVLHTIPVMGPTISGVCLLKPAAFCLQ